ncbi:hypothetical protein MUG87_02175 [Ectobacillus sp. JY-23]|uniref:hypothetical protein n=1 Tax=Ectobacillus sp. JY-23 TaxID=2933872 RepID=UPI001FF3D286|nr:hypothetical protein [Ectobacillus sp. JY-23]UOY92967.1 hypothetical protein MUG87_02175 [Ectobacillus sp. JY-23]
MYYPNPYCLPCQPRPQQICCTTFYPTPTYVQPAMTMPMTPNMMPNTSVMGAQANQPNMLPTPRKF